MRTMRLLSTLLSILLLVSQGGNAAAATIGFAPDLTGKTGAVTGKIPLDRLAGVDIPRGRVSFKGNTITVTTIPEWQFDRIDVLSGVVIRTESTLANGEARIRGLAYFMEGQWLGYISPAVPRETVIFDDNEITGHVSTIDDNAIEFVELNGQRSRIPIASVKTIYSPRAFTFQMAAPAPGAIAGQAYKTEMYRIDVSPTSRTFRMAALKTELSKSGDGDLSRKQLLTIGAAISAIQIGQMLPVLIYPLESHHLWRQANRTMFEADVNPVGTSTFINIDPRLVPAPHGP